MSDETSGEATGNNVEPSTQTETVSISAYKGLQKELQKAKDELKNLKGEPSAEERLAELTATKTLLERELAVSKAKASAPEVVDLIDKFVEKHGIVPDQEIIETLRSRVNTEARPETSGIRNSPSANTADKEEAERQRLLKSELLW